MNYKKCTNIVNDKCIVVKENGIRFQINNPRACAVSKILVDGCLINNDHERCDWIFEIEVPERYAMFVELKGKDVKKALSQLGSTLVQTKERYENFKKTCFVVTSKVPKSGTSIQKLQIEFIRTYGVQLRIKNMQFSESV